MLLSLSYLAEENVATCSIRPMLSALLVCCGSAMLWQKLIESFITIICMRYRNNVFIIDLKSFFPGLFFILFSQFCSLMVVWGLEVVVSVWVFGVGVFIWWGWGLWCGTFWFVRGWGSRKKNKRITLGKKWCSSNFLVEPSMTSMLNNEAITSSCLSGQLV